MDTCYIVCYIVESELQVQVLLRHIGGLELRLEARSAPVVCHSRDAQ